MTELTGKEAKTIHRLLEVEWDEHDRPIINEISAIRLSVKLLYLTSSPWWI